MSEWEPEDDLAQALAALRAHDAPPARVERIHSLCVASLAARRASDGASARHAAAWRSWLEPVVALGLGLLYVADVVRRALEVYR